MAWDHICIAYPCYTFKGMGLVFSEYPQNYLRVMRYPQDPVKYTHRGYRMHTLAPQLVECGVTDIYQQPLTRQELIDKGTTKCFGWKICPKYGRVFGDSVCAIIPFVSVVRYSAETLYWQLGGYGCGELCTAWNSWVLDVGAATENTWGFRLN